MTLIAPCPHDSSDASMGTRGQLARAEHAWGRVFRNLRMRSEPDIGNHRIVVGGAPGRRCRAWEVVFVSQGRWFVGIDDPGSGAKNPGLERRRSEGVIQRTFFTLVPISIVGTQLCCAGMKMMHHTGEPRVLQSLQRRLLEIAVEITCDQRTCKIGNLRKPLKPFRKGMSGFCATLGIAPLAIVSIPVATRCSLARL